MKQGFVKAASATPAIRVADPVYNAQVICEQMEEAVSHGATIVVFPELCITGYTCGDLFLQEKLLREAKPVVGRGKGSVASDHGADCKNGCRDTGGTSDRERRPVIQCCGGITSRRYPGNDPEEKHSFLRRIL